MNRTLEEHYQTVFQQVQTNAEVSGQFVEDAFFDYFCDDLVNAGEFAHADRARYAPATGGIRVDGYAGDPSECDDVLTLIVLDFSQRLEIERLTQVEMNSAFGRLERFLRRSLDERFEPPRLSWRLQQMRRWSHDEREDESIFA
jgi:hypothetical protein